MIDDVKLTFEFARLPRRGHLSLPAIDRAIFYHVRRGAVRVKVAGRMVEIRQGECVSLPVGSAHVISHIDEEGSSAPLAIVWQPSLSAIEPPDRPSDADAILFRSTISLSANAYPGLLPQLVLMDSTRQTNFPGFGALIELFEQTVEMPQRLRVLAQPRLAELVATAIDIVGLAEMETIIPTFSGQDGRMRRTLERIHESPEAPWTLDNLAQACGASRSAFVAQFKQLVGDTPLGYITKLRMYKAARLLRSGELGLSDIAAQMGYTTDASFCKAFTRVIGLSPGRFRSGFPKAPGRRNRNANQAAETAPTPANLTQTPAKRA